MSTVVWLADIIRFICFVTAGLCVIVKIATLAMLQSCCGTDVWSLYVCRMTGLWMTVSVISYIDMLCFVVQEV